MPYYIVILVNLILSEAEISPEDLCLADLNGDGEVNVVDIIQLMNLILTT